MGKKKEANSVRITLLRGSLWKKQTTICFNNWSQPNHKSSLLNHDLISKIKGPKQQFLWLPPPSLLLVAALFFMKSSSSLFRVAASQTRPPLKLHSIFLPSWLPQLVQLGSQILSDKNPTLAWVLTPLGCSPTPKASQREDQYLLCLWHPHRGKVVSWLILKAKLKSH